MRKRAIAPAQAAANLRADGVSEAELTLLFGVKVIRQQPKSVVMAYDTPDYAQIDARTASGEFACKSSAEREVCGDWRKLPYCQTVGMGSETLYFPREIWREIWHKAKAASAPRVMALCALAATGEPFGAEQLVAVACSHEEATAVRRIWGLE